MKKGIILNFKKFKLVGYVTQNKTILFLSIIYILGIFISVAWLSDNSKIIDLSKKYIESYFELHNSSNFLYKLFKRFINYFLILVLYFLSGSSMFGIAVTPFLTIWQGIFFGALSSQLYISYGIMGVAFNSIIVIPTTTVFIISCFFAAKYALEFSLIFAKLSLPYSKPLNLYAYFKKYCFNYLIIVSVTLICTLIEIILNLLFLKFFNF